MEPLLKQLADKYGYDTPIMTSEIIDTWSEYSRPRVFQLLKKFNYEQQLIKYENGVYYLPTLTIFGKPSILNRRQVLEKKYIQDGDDVFGYYSGLSLLNSLGLTTQVPAKPEIVSSKASATVRKIPYGKLYATVRKARVPISKENVSTLELLEAFNNIPKYWLDESSLKKIKEFVDEYNIKQCDVFKYAGLFPAKAIKNLMYAGVENVFTQ